ELANVFFRGTHTKVHDESLAARIRRRNNPMMPRPVKLLIQPDFRSGMVFSRMSPE
ncbi:Bacteriocin-type signal sequence-containing protein, partial [Dysosmobacter welbionis]